MSRWAGVLCRTFQVHLLGPPLAATKLLSRGEAVLWRPAPAPHASGRPVIIAGGSGRAAASSHLEPTQPVTPGDCRGRAGAACGRFEAPPMRPQLPPFGVWKVLMLRSNV